MIDDSAGAASFVPILILRIAASKLQPFPKGLKLKVEPEHLSHSGQSNWKQPIKGSLQYTYP